MKRNKSSKPPRFTVVIFEATTGKTFEYPGYPSQYMAKTAKARLLVKHGPETHTASIRSVTHYAEVDV